MLVWQPINGNTICPSPKAMASLSSSSSMAEKVQHMRNVPCDWATQTLNLGAFLWKNLFGLEVPYETELTSESIKKGLGINKKQKIVLRHCYYHYH